MFGVGGAMGRDQIYDQISQRVLVDCEGRARVCHKRAGALLVFPKGSESKSLKCGVVERLRGPCML